MSNIKNLISNNQSIWLDSISKQMLDSGDLSKIIDLGITGITSNPSIFDKAISSSEVYDETIREISNNISDPKGVFEELAIRDIQRASDLLFKIYGLDFNWNTWRFYCWKSTYYVSHWINASTFKYGAGYHASIPSCTMNKKITL